MTPSLLALLSVQLTAAGDAGNSDVPAIPEATEVLTLEQALITADAHQPQIQQAVANANAAGARQDETLGPLLPQITGTAAVIGTQYFGQNSNVIGVSTPGGGGNTVAVGGGIRTTLGLTANQLIWDFGLTLDRYRSFQAAAKQYHFTLDETRVQTHLTVRSAYYSARALRGLLVVAHETLDNEKKHLDQTEAMVRVGTKPEIALAQEKTNYANDVFLVIQATGNYSTGKAQLNQAMGIQGPLTFEVQKTDQPPVPGEDQPIDELLAQALKSRPAYAAIQEQVNAQALVVDSYKGSYWPALSFQAGVFTYATNPHNFAGDYYGEFLLNWNLFNGLTNVGNVNEQKSNLVSLQAQRDQLEQQIRFDLEQSRDLVLSTRSGLDSANQAVINAAELLRLAEARYTTGVGSYIELGDAQVSNTNAQVQQIQAVFNLNNARATLLAKLGGG
jgi:outer membrane protein